MMILKVRYLMFPVILLVAIGLASSLGVTLAASGEGPFYKGKTIRISVGTSPGGAYDIYSRAIARHISKHIPGNPTILVENRPGGGGRISINYLYNKAKPDGLTMANWNGALSLQQYLGGPGIAFDATKLEWIGSPLKSSFVCMVSKKTGITNIKKWMDSKEPIHFGGMAPGSTFSDVPRIVSAALGVPVKVVEGYKGGSKIRFAVQRGEVDGACGAWEALRTHWGEVLEKMTILVQGVSKSHPQLPNVPLAIDYAKSETARLLVKVRLHDMGKAAQVYTLPPGIPKERLHILRKAFLATLRDPDFVSEAKKSKFAIDPTSGQELAKIISDLEKLSPAVLTKLKKVLSPKKQ